MKIETKRNFDFVNLKKNLKKSFKNFQTDNLEHVAKQLKENITKGTYFNNPIHEVTKEVRRLRGSKSATKPLVDTGRLLKSIKKTKKGISTKGYGVLQNDGYTIKPGHAFYIKKTVKKKTLIRVGSKVVDPRPWIIYKPKKKELDLFFKDFMGFLRIPMKSVGKKSLTI